ncbi:MAG: hypothetical protein ACLRWQ_19885 [Flavonifractor plautii]
MPRDKRGEKPEWYPLDNAGVLYSALQKEKYSAIYRFSAVMAERVDRDALQRAVDKTMPRFPSFGVRIKKGAFWVLLRAKQRPRALCEGGYLQPLPAGALPGGQRLAGTLLLL